MCKTRLAVGLSEAGHAGGKPTARQPRSVLEPGTQTVGLTILGGVLGGGERNLCLVPFLLQPA